jgi:hexosaminidase
MTVLSPRRGARFLAAAALLACSNADSGAPRTPEGSGSNAAEGGQTDGDASTSGSGVLDAGATSSDAGDSAVNDGAPGVVVTLGPLLPQESWPKTIPSVREWHEWKSDGAAFQLTSQTRITVPAGASQSITRTANVLANDLQALLGTKPTIIEGDDAAAGDISLDDALEDAALGPEGYVLLIDGRVRIHGRSDAGTFWGTRTLLQLLVQSANHTLHSAAARDEPSYAERGFMIDNGRAYFSPAWLKAQIKQLAYVKLNLFHWHLADSEGFRIESKTHPEIVSTQHLTLEDVAEIVALAQDYHVEIIPELDVPGHMDAVLAKHPELIAAQDTYPGQQIDYTKSEARTLVHELIEDVIDAFPGRYFHLGTDEFTPFYDAAWDYAQQEYGNNPDIGGMDVAIAFVNELSALVKRHGKTARAWNDVLAPRGVVEQLDTSIVIESWVNRGTTAAAFAGAGFTVLNCNWQCTYSKDEATLLSDACSPAHFADQTTVPEAALRGLKYHVWCDPADEFCPDEPTVSQRVHVPLRALAQSTWGAPRLTADVDAFRELSDAIGAVP